MKRHIAFVSAGIASSFGLALVLAAPAAAESEGTFRCGERLVSPGDHMAEVRDKCGDPDMVTTRAAKRTVRAKVRRYSPQGDFEELTEEREVEVLLDEWVYDFGNQRFLRYVAFENNRVVQILTGARGSKRK